ncbi:hypothetical protein ACWGQ5_55130 [Streptomyces sp. NPDC055722]
MEETQNVLKALEKPTRALSAASVQESFVGLTKEVELPSLDIPWPFASYGITDEQSEAWAGILIALMRKDNAGSKFLMSQVCKTWEEVMSLASFLIEMLVESVHDAKQEETVIRVIERVIRADIA